MPANRRDRARETEVFDPLSLRNLQEVLRERLERVELEEFPPRDFRGAGVYALYYSGQFDLYIPLRDRGRDIPIYVGKAEAGNSSYGEPADSSGLQLVDRIKKHADSVAEASETLALSDFHVRYLPLDDAWIVLAERALLRDYRPVLWNTVMPGFGANAPGSDRQNARSIWDTIHPGRPRAGRLCNRRFTLDEMRERVRLAVIASRAEEGPQRRDAMNSLDAYQRPPIWRPRRRGERGSDVVVQDLGRFLAEMERLKLDVPEYRVANDEFAAGNDPETAAERNTLVAERLSVSTEDEDRS